MIEDNAHKTIVGAWRRFIAHTCLQLWSGNQQLVQSDPNICLGDYFEVTRDSMWDLKGLRDDLRLCEEAICDKEWVEV